METSFETTSRTKKQRVGVLCKICGSRKKEKGVVVHTDKCVEESNQQYNCECGLTFTSKYVIAMHRAICKKVCSCPCGKTFSNDKSFSSHLEKCFKANGSTAVFVCKCRREFKTNRGMSLHKRVCALSNCDKNSDQSFEKKLKKQLKSFPFKKLSPENASLSKIVEKKAVLTNKNNLNVQVNSTGFTFTKDKIRTKKSNSIVKKNETDLSNILNRPTSLKQKSSIISCLNISDSNPVKTVQHKHKKNEEKSLKKNLKKDFEQSTANKSDKSLISNKQASCQVDIMKKQITRTPLVVIEKIKDESGQKINKNTTNHISPNKDSHKSESSKTEVEANKTSVVLKPNDEHVLKCDISELTEEELNTPLKTLFKSSLEQTKSNRSNEVLKHSETGKTHFKELKNIECVDGVSTLHATASCKSQNKQNIHSIFTLSSEDESDKEEVIFVSEVTYNVNTSDTGEKVSLEGKKDSISLSKIGATDPGFVHAISENDIDKPFESNDNDKLFESKNVNKPFESLDTDKPFKSDDTDTPFESKVDLTQNIDASPKLTTNEPEYSINCGKSHLKKGMFKPQKLTSFKKILSCSLCQFKARSKINLRKHVLTRHTDSILQMLSQV